METPDHNGPQHFTLPSRYYTDPELFQKEMDDFFFSRWICVGRDEQVSRPGDYFLRQLGKESLIVTRDEQGTPRCFFNVCRHRGTQLCEHAEGQFKGRIQCRYHAWTYGLDGSLVAAPHMDEVKGFRNQDYPLGQVACESWDGHLWINLARTPTSLKAQLGGIHEKFQNWRSSELRLGKRIHYGIKANWKLLIQNYSECLHCPIIHPALKKLTHYMSGDNEPMNRHYLGGSMTLNDGVQTLTASGSTSRRTLPGLSEHERRHAYFYWVSPNLLLSPHPDYLMTHTLWPRRPDFTDVICEFHFHPDEMTRPEFSAEDAASFWDEVNREDWQVSELSQLGISSRGYRPGPYSNREGLLHALDQLITGTL